MTDAKWRGHPALGGLVLPELIDPINEQRRLALEVEPLAQRHERELRESLEAEQPMRELLRVMAAERLRPLREFHRAIEADRMRLLHAAVGGLAGAMAGPSRKPVAAEQAHTSIRARADRQAELAPQPEADAELGVATATAKMVIALSDGGDLERLAAVMAAVVPTASPSQLDNLARFTRQIVKETRSTQRPSEATAERKQRMQAMRAAGKSDTSIAKELGVSRTLVAKEIGTKTGNKVKATAAARGLMGSK